MTQPAESKYNRIVYGLDGTRTQVDVYRVLSAFQVLHPEVQHAVKKLLCAGLRGKGDVMQDYTEAKLSLEKLLKRLAQEKESAEELVKPLVPDGDLGAINASPTMESNLRCLGCARLPTAMDARPKPDRRCTCSYPCMDAGANSPYYFPRTHITHRLNPTKEST